MALILFFLGLILGSFINALVWRLHSKKDWVRARSQCVHCGHELAPKDLIPVMSWLWLRGRCRYCQQPISAQYPLVELATALWFMLSYVFWPGDLALKGQVILLVTWLAASVGLMALLVYDFRWFLLPNNVLYPAFFIAILGRLAYIVGFGQSKAHLVWLLGLSILVASGLFWLIFMLSKGRWIGYGDVRLGLISGSVLAKPELSLLMIFLSSLMGLIFVLPTLLTGRRQLSTKIPYGPFLIVATAVTLLFGENMINWYTNLALA